MSMNERFFLFVEPGKTKFFIMRNKFILWQGINVQNFYRYKILDVMGYGNNKLP